MLEYRTQGYNGYAVKYSPFFDSRIAVASAANFGLVGNGRLHILGLTERGIVPEKWFDTQDSLFDLSWSEINENQALVAAGDGSIKIFDVAVDQFPVQSWQEHNREVFSVCWNLVSKDTFCSSSWDGTIKVWSPDNANSLLTLPTHSCTYSAAYSPHNPSILSSVSSDSYLRLFDLRTPASASNHLVLSLPIHSPQQKLPPSAQRSVAAMPGGHVGSFAPSEVLTHDWNKYRDTVVATAGVDRLIRTFDIRNANQGPLTVLDGHAYAVRRLAWSPHVADTLLSASYDMTCRVWTDGFIAGKGDMAGSGREVGRMDRHTEFVVGLDWCMFGNEGWVASVGWDERLCVWDARALPALV